MVEFLNACTGERLYSSFDDDITTVDANSGPFTFESYLRLLDDMDIQIPQEMVSAIENDIRANSGASIKDWTPR